MNVNQMKYFMERLRKHMWNQVITRFNVPKRLALVQTRPYYCVKPMPKYKAQRFYNKYIQPLDNPEFTHWFNRNHEFGIGPYVCSNHFSVKQGKDGSIPLGNGDHIYLVTMNDHSQCSMDFTWSKAQLKNNVPEHYKRGRYLYSHTHNSDDDLPF